MEIRTWFAIGNLESTRRARTISSVSLTCLGAAWMKFLGERMAQMFKLNVEPPLVPPPQPPAPECPACGAETDRIYQDRWGNIVGCPECVKEVDAWDMLS